MWSYKDGFGGKKMKGTNAVRIHVNPHTHRRRHAHQRVGSELKHDYQRIRTYNRSVKHEEIRPGFLGSAGIHVCSEPRRGEKRDSKLK